MEDRRGRAARFLLQSVADAPPPSVAVHADSRFAATRSARGGWAPVVPRWLLLRAREPTKRELLCSSPCFEDSNRGLSPCFQDSNRHHLNNKGIH